jgi:hypothetical protein
MSVHVDSDHGNARLEQIARRSQDSWLALPSKRAGALLMLRGWSLTSLSGMSMKVLRTGKLRMIHSMGVESSWIWALRWNFATTDDKLSDELREAESSTRLILDLSSELRALDETSAA